jgi:hypothetical protein
LTATEAQESHVARLVEAFPELQEALTQHLRDYEELLAHVFYGNVGEWFLDRIETEPGRAQDFARWLEAELEEPDESVVNLICVSFLEALPWPPDRPAERAVGLFGPRLHNELKATQAYAQELHAAYRRDRGRARLALDAIAGLALWALLGLVRALDGVAGRVGRMVVALRRALGP